MRETLSDYKLPIFMFVMGLVVVAALIQTVRYTKEVDAKNERIWKRMLIASDACREQKPEVFERRMDECMTDDGWIRHCVYRALSTTCPLDLARIEDE